MTWTEARPLRTGPGRALAAEVSDRPADAHEIVTGALEKLHYIDCAASDMSAADDPAVLLDTYLRGSAAVAITVDAALGEREFTSAADYAVGGREVEFLPTGATLGMLTVASSAMSQAPWVVKELARWWPEPEGHSDVLGALRERAKRAALAKIRRVS